MTIANQATKVVALGNGSQTVFDYDFLIPTAADVEVIYTDADGVETTLDADEYTITGLNDADGGTVEYPLVGSPIATGTTLTIARNLQYVQLKTIANQGNFYPAVVESALDYATMLAQQLDEMFTRAIVAPITDPDALLPLPPVAQRAGQLLGFDDDGNPIASEPSSALVSSAMQPVVAAATLALARTAMGLGDAAVENIGPGLLDRSGTLYVNFSTTAVSTGQSPAVTDNLKQYVATGPITFTLARANTYFSGFGFWIQSLVDTITVTINANDAFKGQSTGTSLTIPPGFKVFIYTDAASSGIWYLNYSKTYAPIAPTSPGEITPGGRVTLTSSAPVMTSDVTAGTTVYYTPYLHNNIMLYDGEKWNRHKFTELSQALSDSTKSPTGAAPDNNYDMFVWNDAGTIRCTRGRAWAGSDTRGTGAATTELVRLDGCLVNAVDQTNGPAAFRGVYVGTIRTDGSGNVVWIANPAAAAGGGNCKLYCWNMYNRVYANAISKDSTDTWNYTTATWRAANNSNSNRISFVAGQNEDAANIVYRVPVLNAGANVFFNCGIGLDSTSAFTAMGSSGSQSGGVQGSVQANYLGLLGLGYHYAQALEYSQAAGTTTWSGDNGAPTVTQMTLQAIYRM